MGSVINACRHAEGLTARIPMVLHSEYLLPGLPNKHGFVLTKFSTEFGKPGPSPGLTLILGWPAFSPYRKKTLTSAR